MPMTIGKRRLLLLGLAVFMAILAGVLVKVYLDRKSAELEARFADNTEKMQIVVPKIDHPIGARVTIDNFAVRRMPADMIPPDAVRPADIERAEGQTLKIALPLGRPLLWSYLSSGMEPSFSETLDKNKRAVTIAVDELNSISGMIRPNDRIDLFIVGKELSAGVGGEEGGDDDNKAVMPLLQNVLVKATGNIVRREVLPDGRDYDHRYATLTLDLSPEDIGKVLIAEENGELKTALKRPEHQAKVHYPVTRESDLWLQSGQSGGAREGFDVTLYIGGNKGAILPVRLFYPTGGTENANALGAPVVRSGKAALSALAKEAKPETPPEKPMPASPADGPAHAPAAMPAAPASPASASPATPAITPATEPNPSAHPQKQETP